MPGEAARSTEGAGALFAASVLQELRRLGCRGVHLVAGSAAPEPEWVVAAIGPHGSEGRGWRFGIGDAGSGGQAVLLEFAGRDDLPGPAREAIARHVGAAAAIVPGAFDAGPAVLVDRDAMSRRMHDLRNGLNSLLMNTAVLVAKLPASERDGRFARQVQADAERCTAMLQALADAIRPADGPLAG